VIVLLLCSLSTRHHSPFNFSPTHSSPLFPTLQVNIPPWIQRVAPATEKGMWLAILYTAIPVGTAAGYAYSSIMAENLGWEWAYFVEGIFMAPLVCFMFYISPKFPVEHKHVEDNSDSSSSSSNNDSYQAPTTYNPTHNTTTDATKRASSKESFSEPSDQLQIQAPSGPNEDDKLRLRSTSSNHSNVGGVWKDVEDSHRGMLYCIVYMLCFGAMLCFGVYYVAVLRCLCQRFILFLRSHVNPAYLST